MQAAVLSPAFHPSIAPASKSQVDYCFQKYAKLKNHSTVLFQRCIVYNYDQDGNQEIVKFDKSQKNANSLLNLQKGADKQYNGYMSPATRRKVRGIIDNFLTAIQMNSSMKFDGIFPSKEVYPTFLTLTLPSTQRHSDGEIRRRIFGRFMEWLTGTKEKGYSGFGVKNYVWVCETQKNGNIHFHIILDRAVSWKPLQKVWNFYCEKLGYVSAFSAKQRSIYADPSNSEGTRFFVRADMMNHKIENSRKACKKAKKPFNLDDVVNKEKKRQLEAYNRAFPERWTNPNTVDIKKIHDVKKLTAYVSKYMTKEPTLNKFPLKAGEKLVEENGSYFVESETVVESISIEGHKLKTVNIKRRKVYVTFDTRPLTGRIWGGSKNIHKDFVKPMEIGVENLKMVNNYSYSVNVQKYQVAQYDKDMFGELVFTHMKTEYKQSIITDQKRNVQVDPVEYNYDYIRFLKEKYVSKSDIDKATARAGEQFRSMGGMIIPLETAQKDVLALYFPKLREQYQQYYTNMFNLLYAS